MTSDKQLKDKAMDIKGKKYVMVKDRVNYFNENYPDGYITTELVSEPSAEMVVIRAMIVPDSSKAIRYFTGYSQARWGDGYINKTSALENCETSAVGRALAMMGIGVIDSIASVDEINKAENYKPKSVPQDGERFGDKKEECPKCKKGHLIEAATKTGKKFLKCSTQTWDTETQTASGCDYVNWDPTGKVAEAKKKSWDDAISVEEYDGYNQEIPEQKD